MSEPPNKRPPLVAALSDLHFEVTPGWDTTGRVFLRNLTNDFVAFKGEWTTAAGYAVMPRAGLLVPRGVADFSVTLFAMDEVPGEDFMDDILVRCFILGPGHLKYEEWAFMFSENDSDTWFSEETETTDTRLVVTCSRAPVTSLWVSLLPWLYKAVLQSTAPTAAASQQGDWYRPLKQD
eukprot:TRINITY_DN3651_c0_g1_i2.p1 TRINITY_DN3651_c0_g1~~TRINITY_DN3651_c0_g1_i2.p1  ORF type:complete len:179 (+),score=16.91 TRINITY_DN3651_c0_g1_i2:210-746(+)